jgi:hypothetical protein
VRSLLAITLPFQVAEYVIGCPLLVTREDDK